MNEVNSAWTGHVGVNHMGPGGLVTLLWIDHRPIPSVGPRPTIVSPDDAAAARLLGVGTGVPTVVPCSRIHGAVCTARHARCLEPEAQTGMAKGYGKGGRKT